MRVNHVLYDKPSPIFNDILDRFGNAMTCDTLVSVEAEPDQDVYVYWRSFIKHELKRPAIAYIHADLSDDCEELALSNYPLIYDHYVCLCNKQAQALVSAGVDESKVTVIHHGYDIKVRSLSKTRRSSLRFGLFSNRYDRLVKGESHLYTLMKYDLESLADKFEFVFSGSGRHVEHFFAQELGYTSSLRAPNNYDALIRMYEDIDVLLILSEAEGGPASFPEALASNTAVLATKVGMVPEFGLGLSHTRIRELIPKLITGEVSIDNYKSPDHPMLQTWEEQIKKHEEVYHSVLL